MRALLRSPIGWLLGLLLLPTGGAAQVSEVTIARTPSDSVSWYRSRDPRRALTYGLRFLKDAQSPADSAEQAKVYTEMGNVYLDQGLDRPAIEAYARALAGWRHLHRWERAGWSYNDLGYVYDCQKQPQLARTHYRRGAALFRGLGAPGYVGLGHTLTNLGSLYHDQRRYAAADTAFRQALALFRRANAPGYVANAQRHLGVNALAMGQPAAARRYLQQALAYFQATADFNQAGLCYLALGQQADTLRQYPAAQQHYQTALRQFQLTQNHEYLAVALLRQGRSCRLMGQPRQALPLVLRALDTARLYQLQPLRLKALRELATAARAAADPARALGYYAQAVAEQEALTGSPAVHASLQEELEQQWATANAEAARFAADRARHRLQLGGLGALALALVVAVGLLLLFLRQRTRSLGQTRQLAAQDRQLLTQQQELARLRAEQLAHELQQRQHELGTMALELVRSNEQLGGILGEVSQLKPYLNGEGQRQVQQLVLRRHLQAQDEPWRVFDRAFQGLHTTFYARLEHRYPDLTANERQLCALLRMGLSNAEITAITLRTLNSVHAAKSRLRKKLGVELDEEMQGALDGL